LRPSRTPKVTMHVALEGVGRSINAFRCNHGGSEVRHVSF
jgi:hypothetical protein